MENDLLKIKIDEARMKLPAETRQAIDAVDWKLKLLEFRETKGYSFTQLDDLEIETELLLCGLIRPEDYPLELETRMHLSKPEVTELVKLVNEKIFQRIRQELIKINIQKEKTKDTNTIQIESRPLEQKPIVQKIEIKKEPEKIKTSTDIEIMPEELPMGEEETEDKEREKILESIENPKPTQAYIAPIAPPAPKALDKTELPTITRKEILQAKIPTPDFLPSKKLFSGFQSQETTTRHDLPSVSKPQTDTTPKPKVDPYREVPE